MKQMQEDPGVARWLVVRSIAALSQEDRKRMVAVLADVWKDFSGMPPSKGQRYALHLLSSVIAQLLSQRDEADDDDVDLDMEVWGELFDDAGDDYA